MRIFGASLLCLWLAGGIVLSAMQKQPTSADRMGLSCTKILEMTSAQWVAKFTREKDASPEGTLRAIAAYGKCYDARTEHLATSVAQNGGGKLLVASANFRNFDQALRDFMAKALLATDPPGDEVKAAYADLYEKQFRYDFYRSYEPRRSHGKGAAASGRGPAAQETEDAGEAKNRFGLALDGLPAGKTKEMHAAFTKIFDSGGPLAEEMKLEVYRFAIFCLETPQAAAKSPLSPPF
jgi:hypothetical protein